MPFRQDLILSLSGTRIYLGTVSSVQCRYLGSTDQLKVAVVTVHTTPVQGGRKKPVLVTQVVCFRVSWCWGLSELLYYASLVLT